MIEDLQLGKSKIWDFFPGCGEDEDFFLATPGICVWEGGRLLNP